ncbi:MAG: SDR family oxidoreductase [Chloroflexi bacterium]|nr:SDR family oxidoreductase [Chloroflexota bacterium]MCI0574826.1 SDR family oxidoreductase [Chloroflexota bacterium]MCI0645956.1 SDR family oxidoreductase [Chloroflexota bacterium]MCI0727601.1 SDR family oxidoreductase [Chloroflexota bacterium]
MNVRPERRRLFITGGSSYLGQHLVPAARAAGHEVCYTYFSQDPLGLPGGRGLDVRAGADVRKLVAEWQPEVVIHAAGSNRSPDMEKVILQGTTLVAFAAREVGARLIHISSDVVFDGRHGPYQESDPPSPLHAYGRAKAEAERIAGRHPNHVVVRTSLIYSRLLLDRSTEWIVASLRAGRPVTLFDNQWRNPVSAESLSQALLELASLDTQGILHVAGRQAMTRAEFCLKLLDWWGVTERETLHIGPSGPEWPLDCRLDVSQAQELLTTPLPGVDEVLKAGDGS